MITADEVKTHIDKLLEEKQDVNLNVVIREGKIKRLVESRIVAGAN